MRTICLVFIIFLACTPKSKSANEIRIEINEDNQYFVNANLVSDDELKEVLLEEKKKIINAGFKGEEIMIILRVDNAVKVKSLNYLETVIRQLNFRKIKYLKSKDLS